MALSILPWQFKFKPAAVTSMTKKVNEELVQDLERRIDTLQSANDDEFGAFTRVDYIILAIVGVILPGIALVLAA